MLKQLDPGAKAHGVFSTSTTLLAVA